MLKEGLDLVDKKILFELDLNSRQPITKIARTLRISKETTNFRLKRLIKNEYIKGFITTLYTSSLNRFYYKIFYKFHKTTPEIDKNIIDFIKTYSKTAWFGTFEGPYDLAFLIIAKSIYDLDEFLTKFRNEFGSFILEQEIHTITSVHRFNLKFFYQGEKNLHTKYPKELKKPNLDNIDYNILKEISNNSRITILELSKKLKIDSGTVIYRIKRLKKEKILGSHVIALNFDKFEMQHFQINLKLVNNNAIEKIISFFSENKNATFATVTLGKYDLAIELVVKDIKELKNILDQLKKIHSQIIIDHDTFLITKEYNVTWFPEP